MVPEKILRNGRIGPIIEVAPCPRDFPTEILVLIIQYLSKSKDIFSFSRVKKSWYSVAYEKLWEYVEISSLKSAVHFRDILRRASFYTSPTGKWTRILKRIDSLVNIFRKSLDCPRESRSLIQRTNTVDLHDLSDSRWHFSPLSIDPCNSLLLALANLPNLRSLVLPKCRITKPMQILSGLKGLEELDLTFCRGGPDGFLDRLLHAIAKNCHRLRKLKFGTSLCMDPSLSHTSALAALGESCPLTQFSMLLNDPKVHMHSSNLSLLFRTCHKLEKVDIQQLCCTEYRTVIRTLIIHNRNLTHLNVTMNSEVDSYADLILLTLTKYASRLEEFRFGPKPLLSDDGLCVFVEECPKLRVLDIHGCPTITHQSLGNFGKLAKKLEILNVSECPGLTFQALTGLAGCSSLKEIHGCRIPSSFSTTKEEVLQTLFEDIPSLDRVYYTLDNGQDTVRHRWDQISR